MEGLDPSGTILRAIIPLEMNERPLEAGDKKSRQYNVAGPGLDEDNHLPNPATSLPRKYGVRPIRALADVPRRHGQGCVSGSPMQSSRPLILLGRVLLVQCYG